MSFWFIVLMIVNKDQTCKVNAKQLLITSILIKILYNIPMNFVIYFLTKCRRISVVTGTILLAFVPSLLLPWYIYVTYTFFASKNNWRNNAPALWIGHLVLMLEALITFLTCLFIMCFWGCFIWMLVILYKNNRKEKLNNEKIK